VLEGVPARNETREDALFKPAEWYAEQEIEALTRCSAMKLDLDARTVKLSNKQEVGFDRRWSRPAPTSGG
jgi:NAD(P)H-nitrite reductase large subunit